MRIDFNWDLNLQNENNKVQHTLKWSEYELTKLPLAVARVELLLRHQSYGLSFGPLQPGVGRKWDLIASLLYHMAHIDNETPRLRTGKAVEKKYQRERRN